MYRSGHSPRGPGHLPHRQRALAGLSAGLGTTLLMVSSTAVHELSEHNLAFHMLLEHVVYMISGWLVAWGLEGIILYVIGAGPRSGARQLFATLYGRLLRINRSWNSQGFVGFTLVAGLFGFWHLPESFTGAVLDGAVHIQMHLTFVMVGGILFVNLRLISIVRALLLLVAVGKIMGVFGLMLTLVVAPLYPVYSIPQHALAGFGMLILMFVQDSIAVPLAFYKLMKPPAADRA